MKDDTELRLKPFFASLDLLIESVEEGVGKSAAKDEIDEEISEKDGFVHGIDDYSFPEACTEEDDRNVWERWNEHCREHRKQMEARGLPPRLEVFSEEPIDMRGDPEGDNDEELGEEHSEDSQEEGS